MSDNGISLTDGNYLLTFLYLPPPESKLGVLVKNGKLKQSKYLVEHTSDLLRVAILSMFGGTYFDNDIILLRRLPSVKKVPNFVGRQDKNLISKLNPPNKTTFTMLKVLKKYSRWRCDEVSTWSQSAG